jgi:hypothetical protein
VRVPMVVSYWSDANKARHDRPQSIVSLACFSISHDIGSAIASPPVLVGNSGSEILVVQPAQARRPPHCRISTRLMSALGHKQTFGKRPPGVRFTPISGHRPTRRMLSRVGTQMWKDWRAI